MSTTATPAHGASHVLPLKVYIGVAGALLVFTLITYEVSLFDFGSANLIIALAVAVFKASLVGLYFMHLRYDHKMYAIVLMSSLFFLACFIGLTLIDTQGRGAIDPMRATPLRASAKMYQSQELSGDGALAGAPATPKDTVRIDSSVTTPASSGH